MKIKVVHVITGLRMGGAEMMLFKLLERLDSRFSPHVISITSLGDIGPRIQTLGIPVEALNMRPGKIPDLREFLRLAQRLKALKPDVVHTWMYHADLLGGLAAKLAGVKSTVWAIHHSNLSADDNKRSTLAVVRVAAMLSYWLPKRILCCSEAARHAHVSFGYAADKMTVVPNGFDLSCFRPDAMARVQVRAEFGIEQDAPLVGLIGRFNLQKNHAGFFQAAGMLHKKLPAVRFLLAGTEIDSDNDELMQWVENAGVIDATHLLGQRSDIPRLMAALDVLASSSVGEAFPNVLGEAMACGVPCAVTNVGDCTAIVGDTGRAVETGDMAGLASAIQDLLTLPAAERAVLGKRTRARVAANYEIGCVVKRYEALYRELVVQGEKRGNEIVL